MKLGLLALTVVALAGCTTTSSDPYAANHTAPSSRKPSSDDSCDSVTPRCQLGDSFDGGKSSPASQEFACKQTVYECEQATVHCRDINGADQVVDTLDYAPHSRDCN